MANDKHQTAVEWYSAKDNELTLLFLENKITATELLIKKKVCLDTAKEMEKEQCVTFYVKGCEDTYGMDEGDDDRKDAERFYNETYGGNK
jgi:hypothetical protein